jgi:hypothetical protein
METDPLVLGSGRGKLTLALDKGVCALAETGRAVAFGEGGEARSSGLAVVFGSGSTAEAGVAVGLDGSQMTAVGQMLAAALGYQSNAAAHEVAFAWNVLSQARAGKIAIAAGKSGVADGLIAIAVGEEGVAVAREGGTIAIAFYDQHPGHWQSAHGCDPTWIDGDTFLAGLQVGRVGENGIQPNHKYTLDRFGRFRDLGPAEQPNPYL